MSRVSSFLLGQHRQCENAAKVLVAALDAAVANQAAHRLRSDGGMVQKVGEGHHFRSGDADAELRDHRLVVGQREKAEAAQAEMTVGRWQADVATCSSAARGEMSWLDWVMRCLLSG